MRPSAGRVSIGTYDIGKLTDKEISRLRGTEVGVVLQGAARNLLPYATLSRNIWLAQTRAAGTKGVKLDDPERILDLVGLGGQGRALVGDLAPGARQRAALAVGIAAGPGLLLVDEPTSQLDTAGRLDAVITETRDRFLPRLAAIPGLDVFPTAANFVLIRCRARPAAEVFRRLHEAHGILVRDLSGSAVLGECLRISIGTEEDMEAVLDALSRILAGEER